jgi:hypothetical protein
VIGDPISSGRSGPQGSAARSQPPRRNGRLRRRRVLRHIERDLADSEPRLVALFSFFTVLVKDEKMPEVEKISAGPIRLFARMRRRAAWPGRRGGRRWARRDRRAQPRTIL